MTHWSRQCRCAGVTGPITALNPGCWCGRNADQEDGLCTLCREQCTNSVVLTMEQTQQRATFQAMAD